MNEQSPNAAVVAAIIPSAGTGTRLAAGSVMSGVPKALRMLHDEPLLRHAVRSLEHAVDQVVVPAPAETMAAMRAALADVGVAVLVVEGGATRQDSVRRGIAALRPDAALVLVHDAARPLTPTAVTDRVVAALRAGAEAVVPVVEVADTLRQVSGAASTTIDRAMIRAVQTPQGFTADVLRRAHSTEDAEEAPATDDAGLAERIGVDVVLVEGDQRGVKVTRAADLLLAQALLSDQASR